MAQTKAQLVDYGTAVASSVPTNGPYLSAANTVAISTNGSGRLFVDSSGRVGVGTSSPYSVGSLKQSLNTSAVGGFSIEASGSDTRLVNYYDSGQDVWILGATYGSTGAFKPLSFWTSDTRRVTIDTSGRVGIGTTSPLVPLVVSNAGAAGIELYHGSGFEGIQAYNRSTSAYTDLLLAGANLRLANATGEAARIDSSNRLLVGTSSALGAAGGAVFQIAQAQANWVHYTSNSASSGDVYGHYIHFSNIAPNNSTSIFLYCGDSSAQRATIRSNGGLANFQANNVNLSDINTKKDISPAAGTWDCIKEWEIVNYRYKDQPDDADLNLGVIAQQVAESCPEVITVFQQATEDEPEKLGVKEQQMYWMAIKALQEAQVRIEQLETEKAEQQTVLDNLLARVAALEAA